MSFKRIVIFSRSLPVHGVGGMEMIAWDLARAFQSKGFDVVCLTTSINNSKEVFIKDRVKVIALKNTSSGKYSSAWFRGSYEYFIKHFNDADTVVFSVSAAAAGLLRRKSLIVSPIVFQAHGTSIGEIKSKLRTLKPGAIISAVKNLIWFFKDIRLYKQSDAIVAVGNKVYEDLLAFPNTLGAQCSNVHLIHNGIDVNLFTFDLQKRQNLRSKFDINDNEKVIISASRLHKQKGMRFGLLGFSEYLKNNPYSTYFIMGDGPEYENLKTLALKLGIEKKVIFTGNLNRDMLAEYLNIGDLFLFTTLHDEVGLPLNVLEALSSGLKVIISSHIQGISNISSDVIFTVDPKSAKEISQALVTKADENRKSYLPNKYSLEYCAGEYIKLFDNLIIK